MSGMDDRTRLIIGDGGVERLRNAYVVLCGCGAVGGYALEGLVRAGVGHIRVIDRDVFSESNLNRQILATRDTVGRPKAEVACERARSINPDIDIEAMDVLVSEETVPAVLEPRPDVLVDAIDTVAMKVFLLKEACARRIRTFSSMGAALHTDPSSVHIASVMKTSVCPVAARVRRGLRDCDTSLITCVYSSEKPAAVPSERDENGKSILGSLPTIPAIFGMTLANEAVMYILGKRRMLNLGEIILNSSAYLRNTIHSDTV